MPWSPGDAKKHTKKANTPKKKRQWSDVANSALADGDSEASAIRQANAAVAGTVSRHKYIEDRRKAVSKGK